MSNAYPVEILEALPDATLVIEAGGRIVQANAAAGQLFGWTQAALPGQGLEALLADCEHARQAAQRATVFAPSDARGTRVAAQFAMRRRDRGEFPAEINLSALPGGAAPRALAVVRDLTDRQRLERALRDSNRLKSEFFGHMSHELLTPLNGIIGFTEFLLEGHSGNLSAEQHEYLGDILLSGRRLLSLINSVMELSRLEAGSVEISLETFSLAGAIEEACSLVAAAAQHKGIGLLRSVAPELWQVSLDRRRLLRVLNYLLANAVRISGEGRDIHIEATPQSGAALRLEIWDTGSGQRSAEFEHLLSDYPQLDSSAIRRFGGAGLDLVLAKKIVEAQSGLFTVEHDALRGHVFNLVLPCVIAISRPAADPATNARW
jgi:PAS domain S-box-containing protein